MSGVTRGPESVIIAFQGVEGAYSERAARHFFGAKAKTLACRDFRGVFAAVRRGTATYGMVPLENSLTGSIHENYDLLLTEPVVIIGEAKEAISHCLLALP